MWCARPATSTTTAGCVPTVVVDTARPVKVDPTIVKRLDRSDGGGAPAKLMPGKYTLHVGQLVSDVEAGPPARIPWEL